MEEKILTPEETVQMLQEFKVEPPVYSIIYDEGCLSQRLQIAFMTAAEAERHKMTHNGLFHNKGNCQPFADYVVKRLGKKHVSYYSNNDGEIRMYVTIENRQMAIDIHDDYLEGYTDFYGCLRLGIHSAFYEEVAHFLFDPDSDYNQLRARYRNLERSISHYQSIVYKLWCHETIQYALSDQTEYQALKERYQNTADELQPLTPYILPQNWDDFFRRHAFASELTDLKEYRRVLMKKPEKSAKYKKKFEKVYAVLEKAKSLGVLTPEESKIVVLWEEFMKSIAGEDMDYVTGDNGYIPMIEKVYERKIRECEEQGTAYMLRKKRKIEKDMELCRQVQAEQGLYCFIDRSHFDAKVEHFNVVTPDDSVWVFRLYYGTPKPEDCAAYIDIVKAILKKRETAKSKGKPFNLKLETILPLLTKYQTRHPDCPSIDLKGIYKKRLPHL